MDLAAEIGRSVRTSFHQHASSFRSTSDVRSINDNNTDNNDDETELQWAAIQRLPTFERLTDEQDNNGGGTITKRVVDVTKLGALERHVFIEKLVKDIEGGNHRLLQKLKQRIDR